MKIAIVDDETGEQEIIAKYMGEWAKANHELTEFSFYESSEAFLFSWEDDKDYALLVLDIEMGGISGLELAKKIRWQDEGIPILFVTGYDEYMQYGYDVAALHYLLKPVQKEKLFQVLDKLGEREESQTILIVNTGNEVRRFPFSAVFYIEADGHGSILHLADETIPVRESFGEMEKRLTTREAVKCHRAYLVNLRYVSAIRNAELILDHGERLPIARSRMKDVQSAFLRYYKDRQGKIEN